MSTFNGRTIVTMPSTPAAPASIEWSATDFVAASESPFTRQQQIQDWQGSLLEGIASMPPLTHVQAQSWIAWLMGLRGIAGVFQIGDPLATAPQGTAAGTLVVSGADQTGYVLNVSGGSGSGCLLPGDWIQIGFRLYRNLGTYDGGAAALSIWPNLRESPTDGASLITTNTKGVFCLKSNTRKWSVSEARMYGISFEIREAI